MTDALDRTNERQNAKPPSTPRGGFIVQRRIGGKGALKSAGRPYEHTTAEQAIAEAQKLAEELGGEFCVFAQVTSFRTPTKPYQPPKPPVPPAPKPPAPEPVAETPVAASGRKVITAKATAVPPPIAGKPAPAKPASAARKK